MNIVINGCPRTKKNSMRIARNRLLPSAAYVAYETAALWLIPSDAKLHIAHRVNVKCVYYMDTARRVDLLNLLSATMDILVKAGVLMDDNCSIVASHDGSRVGYCKENPRVEIMITEKESSHE